MLVDLIPVGQRHVGSRHVGSRRVGLPHVRIITGWLFWVARVIDSSHTAYCASLVCAYKPCPTPPITSKFWDGSAGLLDTIRALVWPVAGACWLTSFTRVRVVWDHIVRDRPMYVLSSVGRVVD